MVGKKGQSVFGLSFGVIFSIILIAVFIVIAFIAIRAFFSTQECAQVGLVVDGLKDSVDRAWRSDRSEFQFERRIPSGVTHVCFMNLASVPTGEFQSIGSDLGVYPVERNFFLYPAAGSCNTGSHTILHLNIDTITAVHNPYCVPVIDGNVAFTIRKQFNEPLVTVE